MKLDLELRAVEQLSKEYEQAVSNPNTSALEVLEIKNRLDTVRLLIIDALIEDLKKAG